MRELISTSDNIVQKQTQKPFQNRNTTYLMHFPENLKGKNPKLIANLSLLRKGNINKSSKLLPKTVFLQQKKSRTYGTFNYRKK